jgi:hypothetical protein
MEIIIVIAIACVLGYWAYQNLNKEKSDGSHPLDSVTTTKTSWPFPGGEVGEGKIHVKVSDLVPVAPAEPTGSENRVETPAPVVAPAKKPAAKKASAKKAAEPKPVAAKKTPAKKKSV